MKAVFDKKGVNILRDLIDFYGKSTLAIVSLGPSGHTAQTTLVSGISDRK